MSTVPFDFRRAARRVGHDKVRISVPASSALRPASGHEAALVGAQVCRTRAGRPRAFHAPSKDGRCIHCDRTVGDELALGEQRRGA